MCARIVNRRMVQRTVVPFQTRRPVTVCRFDVRQNFLLIVFRAIIVIAITEIKRCYFGKSNCLSSFANLLPIIVRASFGIIVFVNFRRFRCDLLKKIQN